MDNKYTVKVFGAGDAGEFMDPEGLDLDVWLQDRAEAGYKLLDLQPVTFSKGLFVLASMELIEVETL